MQSTDRTGPGAAQLLVALREETQHARVIRRRDARQARCMPRRDRDRVAVVRVVLVRAAGPDHPHPSRQRRGHVQHPFTRTDELLCKQIADTAGALHRPRPRLEPGRPRQQLRDLRMRRAHLDRGELHIVAADRDRGVGPLVRIDTNHHRHTCPSRSLTR